MYSNEDPSISIVVVGSVEGYPEKPCNEFVVVWWLVVTSAKPVAPIAPTITTAITITTVELRAKVGLEFTLATFKDLYTIKRPGIYHLIVPTINQEFYLGWPNQK